MCELIGFKARAALNQKVRLGVFKEWFEDSTPEVVRLCQNAVKNLVLLFLPTPLYLPSKSNVPLVHNPHMLW